MKLLGIDIGGTKTAVCVGDEHGQILASKRMPSDPATGLDAYFENLDTLCRDTLLDGDQTALADVSAVGISAPGPLSVQQGMLLAPPNNPGWIDIPIVQKVRDLYNLPVFLNNDANACALAERCFGAHAQTRNLIYLTCSTGMGAGVIVNDALLQGACDMGGEVGHIVVDIEGPPCPCGRRGCWELYVGGKNLADRVRAQIVTEAISTDILTLAGGDPAAIDHRCIAAAARTGDPFALKTWDIYTERLAQGIGGLIQAFNPEAILLGTIALKEGDFLLDPLRRKLPAYAWEWPLASCTIEPCSLGDRIGELAGLAVAVTGLQEWNDSA
ncbi:MAG: ROK family protein [bacterium]|nr:ROK family protein [bacterium]